MKNNLLAPRYLVIADYPGNSKEIGDVYEMDCSETYFYVDDMGLPITEDILQMHPHLFRPLLWWEFRDEKEMPEYVKFTPNRGVIEIIKVGNWTLKNEQGWICSSRGYSYHFSTIEPATLEEYESFTKK